MSNEDIQQREAEHRAVIARALGVTVADLYTWAAAQQGAVAGGAAVHVVRRGFASLSSIRRSVVSQHGGQRAQDRGTAHRWTSAEAKAAYQKSRHAVKSAISEVA